MSRRVTLARLSVDGVVGIGIDVAKGSLEVGLWFPETEAVTLSLGNIETDVNVLAEALSGYSGKVVMESTGAYHLLPAILLAEAGLDVRVVNPLLATKYTKASVRKVKTDRYDAASLAEMAYKEGRLPTRFAPGGRKELLAKKKLSLLSSLERQLQSLTATLNAYDETLKTLGGQPSETEQKISNLVNELKQSRNKLEQEVVALGKELTQDQQTLISNLDTIPGVSTYLATVVGIHFSVNYNRDVKQWIAYVGLDVSVKQSGLWQGRGKLTKRGNRYLRKRLFSAAWGASMHDPQFAAYYQKLKQEGRHHYEALNIIARKLIRIMYALAQANSTYDPTKVKLTGGVTV